MKREVAAKAEPQADPEAKTEPRAKDARAGRSKAARQEFASAGETSSESEPGDNPKLSVGRCCDKPLTRHAEMNACKTMTMWHNLLSSVSAQEDCLQSQSSRDPCLWAFMRP